MSIAHSSLSYCFRLSANLGKHWLSLHYCLHNQISWKCDFILDNFDSEAQFCSQGRILKQILLLGKHGIHEVVVTNTLSGHKVSVVKISSVC